MANIVKDNSNQKRLDSMALPKLLSNKFSYGLLNALDNEVCSGRVTKYNKQYRRYIKQYLSSLYCNNGIEYDAELDKLVQSGLCKRRWCQFCQRIQTAHYINSYGKQLETLPEKYFLTLTAPTVPAESLKQRIQDFERHWREILKMLGKYTRKGTLSKPMGIRKMECTLRPNNHYHYHYHILIDNKKVAEFILSQWLKHFPTASFKSQDLRKADNGSVHELFKYFTKLSVPLGYFKANLTTAERKECTTKMATFSYEKTKSKENHAYYSAYFTRMHFLFTTLYRKRVFQPFGTMKMAKDTLENEPLRRPDNQISNVYHWDSAKFHWVGNLNSAEQLSYINVVDCLEKGKNSKFIRKRRHLI